MKITITMFTGNNYARIHWAKMIEMTIDFGCGDEPAAANYPLHRTDGPALLTTNLERDDLRTSYFINGTEVSKYFYNLRADV